MDPTGSGSSDTGMGGPSATVPCPLCSVDLVPFFAPHGRFICDGYVSLLSYICSKLLRTVVAFFFTEEYLNFFLL